MTVAFVRQLGAESGVQLNPLRDNSEIPSTDNSDQVFGIMMRATRGRIDKPFVVDSGNVYAKLGNGEPVRKNALNEAWVHVVEALSNGAYQCVVQRLVKGGEAKIKWAVCKLDAETPKNITFEVSDTEPEGFFFAVKHLECFNDGIKLAFHAEAKRVDGQNAANDVITLRVLDKSDVTLYEFTGSLDEDAKDDYGNSNFLPDVIASQTDALEMRVGVKGEAAVVDANSAAYDWDENGRQKWVTSDVLVCFTEGQTTYDTADFVKARTALQNCPYDFAYISSGGSKDSAMLGQLAMLAYDTNKQLRFDVPGNLDPEAAVKFVEDLNLGANKCPHLMHAFWAPFISEDPTGVNPKGHFGVATLNIALACARNAQVNAKGFAPKNYPIAGREHQISRQGIVQKQFPTSKELNVLANAKINPCGYMSYTGGGRYVFIDSLTCAPVSNSLRKLISVADMSTSIDDAVTRAGKDFLQLPMKVAVDKMKTFMKRLLEDAEASGWLVPSNDPAMKGRSHVYVVKPSEARPYDVMVVDYYVRYDGTARQIHVTQTITK